MKPLTLHAVGIQLGLGCPLRCRHCYVSAGPHHRRTLALKRALAVVDGFADHRDPRLPSHDLLLTGGEPFLFRELTRAVTRRAVERGLSVFVNTSAYFAATEASARKALAGFEELRQLEVSLDSWHADFVGPALAVRCLRVARELGIPTQLSVQRHEIGTFAAEVGEARSLGATICLQDYAPIGERNGEAGLESALTRPMTGGCAKVGNLVFDEHGNAYPCSSAVVMSRRRPRDGVVPGFVLGHIDEGFAALVARMTERRSLSAIAHLGPDTLADLCGSGPRSDSGATYCDRCILLHRDGTTAALDSGEGVGELFQLADLLM